MRKKSLLIILLVACMIFSVSSVAANDGNDTSLASDENNPVVDSGIEDVKASSNTEDQPLKESTTDNGTFTALQRHIEKHQFQKWSCQYLRRRNIKLCIPDS